MMNQGNGIGSREVFGWGVALALGIGIGAVVTTRAPQKETSSAVIGAETQERKPEEQRKRSYVKARVSFGDFKGLVAEVEAHRASRLVDLDTFLKMSQEPGVIVLDSRSKFRYDRIHLKGAKHLAFTDFTQGTLAQVIPSLDTKILIYCNNNFDGNQTDFSSKVARPSTGLNSLASAQLTDQAKPLMMALNIPTYVNLYGYGYRNVYELDELVKVSDKRVSFEGTVSTLKPPPAGL